MEKKKGCSCCSCCFSMLLYIALLVLVTLYAPFMTDFKPISYRIPLPFKYNEALMDEHFPLDEIEKIAAGNVIGPSTLLANGNAGIFVGTFDGKLLRVKDNQVQNIITIEKACKSEQQNSSTMLPLNTSEKSRDNCPKISSIQMSERREQTIYFNDAVNGVYAATPSGEKISLNVLANRSAISVACRATKFIDQIAIDDRNRNEILVYAIDQSGTFDWRSEAWSMFQPETDGRVLKLSGNGDAPEVIMRNLWAPSGVALTDDSNALLVSESAARRVSLFNLNSMQSSLILTHLPGEPRHIRRSLQSDESYWLALRNGRSEQDPIISDYLSEYPTIRLLIAKISYAIGYVLESAGEFANLSRMQVFGAKWKNGRNFVLDFVSQGKPMAIEISKDGRILNLLQASMENSHLSLISEVIEISPESDNVRTILIGSESASFIGKVSFKMESKMSSMSKLSKK